MQSTSTKSSGGFTLVEVVVVAPLIILFIGTFIGLIMALTGDGLRLRESNASSYDIQDALMNIESTASVATSFQSSTGPLTSPQGKNDSAAAFTTTESGKPDTLIITSAATTKNPLDPTSEMIYSNIGGCPSATQPFTYTSVYFVADKTLYKRVIVPTSGDCSTPWQRSSCTMALVATNSTVCKASDEKLLEGVDSMTTEYYANSASTVALSKNAAELAGSVSVQIALDRTVAGESLKRNSSMRISSASIAN